MVLFSTVPDIFSTFLYFYLIFSLNIRDIGTFAIINSLFPVNYSLFNTSAIVSVYFNILRANSKHFNTLIRFLSISEMPIGILLWFRLMYSNTKRETCENQQLLQYCEFTSHTHSQYYYVSRFFGYFSVPITISLPPAQYNLLICTNIAAFPTYLASQGHSLLKIYFRFYSFPRIFILFPPRIIRFLWWASFFFFWYFVWYKIRISILCI